LKSLNYWQLVSYSEWLMQTLVDAVLQDAWSTDEHIVLEFYKKDLFYLWIHPSKALPLMALFAQKPPIQKKKKPVTLFLNSRAANFRVERIWVEEKLGRVLNLELSKKEDQVLIQIVLIPKLANVSVEHESTQIFWFKPSELPQNTTPDFESVEMDWGQRSQDLWTLFFAPKQSANTENLSRLLQKKEAALKALLDSDLDGQIDSYQQLGESLKSNTLNEEQKAQLDPQMSLGEQLKKIFAKVQDLKRKKLGTQQRMDVLKTEIERLRKGEALSVRKTSELLKKAQAQGRTLHVADNWSLVYGKNAEENLKILRKAASWHLWFHVKNYPGSHAVLAFPKGKKVPDEVILKSAQVFVQETLGKKKQVPGVRWDVIVTECRFVRPIKGDKLGRVTYQNEKTFSVASNAIN
jgi:predicted ribosome quality control (RQC) complex YloA/Tae2 family protein